jgi:hypothetical protein
MPEAAPADGPRTSPLAALARTALLEITPDETIGAEAPPVDEVDGVVSVRFATLLPGYPGWFWTVSVAQVEGSEPTVLEVELLPGEHALVAPDWVPWADRLAEMQAQEAGDGDEDDTDDESDDEDSDDDDSDDDDSDEDGGPRPVHGGDVDGVDIDDLADDEDDSDEDDSDDDDDDDSDDSDDSDDGRSADEAPAADADGEQPPVRRRRRRR